MKSFVFLAFLLLIKSSFAQDVSEACLNSVKKTPKEVEENRQKVKLKQKQKEEARKKMEEIMNKKEEEKLAKKVQFFIS